MWVKRSGVLRCRVSTFAFFRVFIHTSAHLLYRVVFPSEAGVLLRMFCLASSSAAHIAAPTVLVNESTSPIKGIKLRARVAAPNLDEHAVSLVNAVVKGKLVRRVLGGIL
jgi:hypothetical protein